LCRKEGEIGVENSIQTSGFVIQPRLQFKKTKDMMLYQLFVYLANYENSTNCKRGQLITSSLSLSNETGWTRAEIRGSIKRLEDDGHIISKPYKRNKGLLITVSNYDDYQKLTNYNKKINQQDNQQDNQHNSQQDNQQGKPEIPCDSKEDDDLKNENNQQDNQQGSQQDSQLNNHTITTYINSIINNNINNNITLKEYIAEAPVKNKNLTTTEEIETFVDFATQTNALPAGINSKLLVSYFDCIRLTRQTCTISANILVKFLEKIQKYSANQIHYALWKHIDQHDDKRESYTLGILRNTKEPEARRGLIKLKNRNGGENLATNQSSDQQKYDYGF
jgi:predicted transcriptional regulator